MSRQSSSCVYERFPILKEISDTLKEIPEAFAFGTNDPIIAFVLDPIIAFVLDAIIAPVLDPWD